MQSRWLSRDPRDALWLVSQARDLGELISSNARGQARALGPYR